MPTTIWIFETFNFSKLNGPHFLHQTKLSKPRLPFKMPFTHSEHWYKPFIIVTTIAIINNTHVVGLDKAVLFEC